VRWVVGYFPDINRFVYEEYRFSGLSQDGFCLFSVKLFLVDESGQSLNNAGHLSFYPSFCFK